MSGRLARWARLIRRRPWRSAGQVLARLVRGALAAGAAFVIASTAAADIAGLIGAPPSVLMLRQTLAGADVRRAPVRLEAVSPHLVHAVIGAEDSRFCTHHGFDLAEIRAVLAGGGAPVRGASTISQQTAKNLFLWNEGGWARKALEAWFTAVIEASWPKRRILETYLNLAEWGDGLFGAEAAARARFGKPASALTAREAALMAAVLPSPNRWRLDPPGEYVARRAGALQTRAGVVARDGLAGCLAG